MLFYELTPKNRVKKVKKKSMIHLLPLKVYLGTLIWPRGYKTLFMLNSFEYEFFHAHKYKNIKKFGFYQAQIRLECFFFYPLINCWHFNIYKQEKIHAQLS